MMYLGRLLHPQPAYWIDGATAAVKAWPGHGDPLPHNMLWTPAGLVLIDGDDLFVPSAMRAPEVSIIQSVTAWATTRPPSARPYRGAWTSPYRRLRFGTGRVLRRRLGRERVARIKRLMGPFG
jgi:hypothetical protein